jgi:hypothetical protein
MAHGLKKPMGSIRLGNSAKGAFRFLQFWETTPCSVRNTKRFHGIPIAK